VRASGLNRVAGRLRAMKRALFVLLACLVVCGCSARPRAGDPKLRSGPVRTAWIGAPAIHLRPVQVGGMSIPKDPLARTAERIARYTGRPVHVEAACAVTLEPGEYDVLSRILDELGRQRPLEPGTVLVVPVGGVGVTGYLSWRGDQREGAGQTPIVVLKPETVAHRSGLFVSAAKLSEWTLTHELGHVLNVPASNTHAWIVPGLGGNHCTHPECVMYTGFDWRVLWTGIVRGWPMDFCELCSAEIRAAREAAAAGEAGRAAGGPTVKGKEPP
jgi:hypothetical protein